MSTGILWEEEKQHKNKIKYGLETLLWKKERINYHREYITDLLTGEIPSDDIDWEEVLNDHLIKISQFQHERFMHLIVTMTFALCAIIVMCFSVFLGQMILTLLLLAILLLLIPYIFYYFMLENNTQAMYPLYDGIMEKLRQKKTKHNAGE